MRWCWLALKSAHIRQRSTGLEMMLTVEVVWMPVHEKPFFSMFEKEEVICHHLFSFLGLRKREWSAGSSWESYWGTLGRTHLRLRWGSWWCSSLSALVVVTVYSSIHTLHSAGRHELRSFLAASSTQNYVERMLRFLWHSRQKCRI